MIGTLLVFLGLLIIIAGILMSLDLSGGGVGIVIIGPVPIVVKGDPLTILGLSLVIFLLFILLILLTLRRIRSSYNYSDHEMI